jgi:hypothetical protein
VRVILLYCTNCKKTEPMMYSAPENTAGNTDRTTIINGERARAGLRPKVRVTSEARVDRARRQPWLNRWNNRRRRNNTARLRSAFPVFSWRVSLTRRGGARSHRIARRRSRCQPCNAHHHLVVNQAFFSPTRGGNDNGVRKGCFHMTSCHYFGCLLRSVC